MTLLVAGIHKKNVWMVADTAITGSTINLRERIYSPKIEAAHNSSLLGFAGEASYGSRFIREAAQLPPGETVLDALVTNHRSVPSVEFAYAFQTERGPHLFRVADAKAEELQTLHLGIPNAFEAFQRIRHELELEPPPKAVSLLLSSDLIPQDMRSAISTMLRLFASREEHDVGGWVVPYLLTPDGASLCSYTYTVTDPIIGTLPPGALIPDGTAKSGGFDLFFAGLPENDGMVVYWLQLPGGLILLRDENGYAEHKIRGTPRIFSDQAKMALGREVEIGFGDQPIEIPSFVSYLRDEAGRPRLAVLRWLRPDRIVVSLAWIQNTKESFSVKGNFPVTPISSEKPDPAKPMKIDAFLPSDAQSVTLTLLEAERALGHAILGPAELDQLIAALCMLRANMAVPVPSEVTSLVPNVIDPVLRASPPDPSTIGPVVALRHPGFGWLSFVFPDNEARHLGQWLVDHASPVPT